MLEAQRNEGVHSLIHHPLMSVFWRKCFTGQNDVPWTLWWEAFPEELRRVQAVPQEVGHGRSCWQTAAWHWTC